MMEGGRKMSAHSAS